MKGFRGTVATLALIGLIALALVAQAGPAPISPVPVGADGQLAVIVREYLKARDFNLAESVSEEVLGTGPADSQQTCIQMCFDDWWWALDDCYAYSETPGELQACLEKIWQELANCIDRCNQRECRWWCSWCCNWGLRPELVLEFCSGATAPDDGHVRVCLEHNPPCLAPICGP